MLPEKSIFRRLNVPLLPCFKWHTTIQLVLVCRYVECDLINLQKCVVCIHFMECSIFNDAHSIFFTLTVLYLKNYSSINLDFFFLTHIFLHSWFNTKLFRKKSTLFSCFLLATRSNSDFFFFKSQKTLRIEFIHHTAIGRSSCWANSIL